MKHVQALLESADTQNILTENAALVEDASTAMMYFYGAMQNYIQENIVEFLDENLEETAKNIYTFSTYATKQMLTEVATVYGRQIQQKEVLKEAARTEFV